MYRILIKTIKHTNVEVLSWHTDVASETKSVWETNDITVALNEYKELLDKYPASSLTLANAIPVAISVDDTLETLDPEENTDNEVNENDNDNEGDENDGL